MPARRLLPLLVALVLVAGCGGEGDEEAQVTATSAPVETVAATTQEAAGGESEARDIFAQNCSGCHTLKAAGTTGKVGPNLDRSKPSLARARTMLIKGGGGGLGVMPSYRGTLSEAQIEQVARYVVESTGG